MLRGQGLAQIEMNYLRNESPHAPLWWRLSLSGQARPSRDLIPLDLKAVRTEWCDPKTAI